MPVRRDLSEIAHQADGFLCLRDLFLQDPYDDGIHQSRISVYYVRFLYKVNPERFSEKILVCLVLEFCLTASGNACVLRGMQPCEYQRLYHQLLDVSE